MLEPGGQSGYIFTMSLPIDTRVLCKLTDKLGYTVDPPPPEGYERVMWDGYTWSTLQWSSLLIAMTIHSDCLPDNAQ